MAGTAGKYGSFPKNNPGTRSVETRTQPTQRNNGRSPSSKHWGTKSMGSASSGPPTSGASGGAVSGTRTQTEHLNAGAKRRFGGKAVKGLV